MHSFRHRQFIPHPPEKVWSILMDFPAWLVWNTLHAEAPEGAAVGAPFRLRIPLGSGRWIPAAATFTEVDYGRALVWRGGVKGIFHAEHGFRLTPEPGGTQVEHFEEFRGVLVLPVLRLFRPRQEDSYGLVNVQLGEACRVGGG